MILEIIWLIKFLDKILQITILSKLEKIPIKKWKICVKQMITIGYKPEAVYFQINYK